MTPARAQDPSNNFHKTFRNRMFSGRGWASVCLPPNTTSAGHAKPRRPEQGKVKVLSKALAFRKHADFLEKSHRPLRLES